MSIISFVQIAVQVLTFAIVVAVSATLIGRLPAQADVRRRLGAQVTTGSRPTSASLVRKDQVTNPFLLWVQRSTSLADAKDQAKLTRELAMAGIQHPAAPILYVVLRFGLAISLPLVFLL